MRMEGRGWRRGHGTCGSTAAHGRGTPGARSTPGPAETGEVGIRSASSDGPLLCCHVLPACPRLARLLCPQRPRPLGPSAPDAVRARGAGQGRGSRRGSILPGGAEPTRGAALSITPGCPPPRAAARRGTGRHGAIKMGAIRRARSTSTAQAAPPALGAGRAPRPR